MRRQGLPAEATMFVAFMLVIQAFLSGLSLGAEAASLRFDASVEVICTADGAAAAGEIPPGASHEHHLDCCLFGCSMVGGEAPSVADIAFVPSSGAIMVASPATQADRTVERVELLPRNPRAPPPLA